MLALGLSHTRNKTPKVLIFAKALFVRHFHLTISQAKTMRPVLTSRIIPLLSTYFTVNIFAFINHTQQVLLLSTMFSESYSFTPNSANCSAISFSNAAMSRLSCSIMRLISSRSSSSSSSKVST